MADTIPTDARAFWFTTNASIPTGWSRQTVFDDRYLQGKDSGYTGEVNGGSANHTHTPDNHGHAASNHTHTVVSSADNISGSTAKFHPDAPTGGPFHTPAGVHSHASVASALGAIIIQSNTSVTIDVKAADPQFTRAIIISPDAAGEDLPVTACGFCDLSSPPTDFRVLDGAGGAPSASDRFIKGAATGGGDGGGTGGSTTHDHTSPTHTHNLTDHDHPGKNMAASDTLNDLDRSGDPNETDPVLTVHHNLALADETLTDLSSDSLTLDATSSDPSFIKLLGIQNNGAGATTPDNLILPYTGTPASIPSEWELCDGSGGTPNCDNKQVKNTTSGGAVGDTGGSDTHTHTSPTHSHSHSGSHDHTIASVSTFNRTRTVFARTGGSKIGGDHTHTWTIGSTTPPDPVSTVVTIQSADVRIINRTVIWIRKKPPAFRVIASTGGWGQRTRADACTSQES